MSTTFFSPMLTSFKLGDFNLGPTLLGGFWGVGEPKGFYQLIKIVWKVVFIRDWQDPIVVQSDCSFFRQIHPDFETSFYCKILSSRKYRHSQKLAQNYPLPAVKASLRQMTQDCLWWTSLLHVWSTLHVWYTRHWISFYFVLCHFICLENQIYSP